MRQRSDFGNVTIWISFDGINGIIAMKWLKLNRWLFISAAGFMLSFVVSASCDCSPTLRGLRGNSAAIFGLSSAVVMAISVLYFGFQTYQAAIRNLNFSGLIFAFFVFCLVGIFVLLKALNLCALI